MRLLRYLAVACLPIAAAASQEPRRVSHSSVEGVVVDSLRGGFLRGASVTVAGAWRIAVTDSLGRYRIDSVPPGTYQVELFHEILDTLAVRVYTQVGAIEVYSSASVPSEFQGFEPCPTVVIWTKRKLGIR